MSFETNEISLAQRASWNRFSPGWKKWDAHTMAFLAPHGDAIVDYLAPGGTQVILDIAAGTGEPGLSIARRLRGGRVVITDLADGMLAVAKEKAARAGVTNVEFREADACALPFPDNTFDAVSCRLGYMFFPDMAIAAREMARVVKPGGRVATTVWGAPERNFWVTCMVQNIGKHMDVPPTPPGAPGMFRCAQPGLIAGLFKTAGLSGVAEREVPCTVGLSGPAEYWEMVTEISAPFVGLLSKADAATVARIKAGVLAAMGERHPDGKIPACGILITGRK